MNADGLLRRGVNRTVSQSGRRREGIAVVVSEAAGIEVFRYRPGSNSSWQPKSRPRPVPLRTSGSRQAFG